MDRINWGEVFAGAVMVLFLNYLTWQFGRMFGQHEVRQDLVGVIQQGSFPTYFFREDQAVSVASDAGLIRPVVVRSQANLGRCFTDEADRALLDLLR